MRLEFVCIVAYIHSSPCFIAESYSVVHSLFVDSCGIVGFMACYDDPWSRPENSSICYAILQLFYFFFS